ncbi:MAG: serine hydrolase [Gemmatimonadaceae bacterium]|nr:serine hydrolase [Gemmatimonadaceae bacterium]
MPYRTICKLFALLLLLARPGAAQQAESRYHEAFRRLHEAGMFNGAVLIAKDDSIVLDAAFGESDVTTHTPLTDRSLYRAASVSKTVTALALLTLVDSGRLDLDDPVQRYLPRFPYPQTTLRQLLQHSSGLPEYIFGVGDYWSSHTEPMTDAAVLRWLIDTTPELDFAPGQGWDYCNTNYALIPLVIEAVTREPYAVYLRRAVLEPAGMRNSFHLSELGPRERARLAAGHGFDYATGQDLRIDRHPVLSAEFNADSVFGAGDLVSTARDLFALDQALKAGQVISLELQATAYTSMVLPEGFPAGYGLGWQVAESDFTGRIIHHHGQGDGYRTRYYRFLDRGITIITLQNAREKYADDAVRVAQLLAFKDSAAMPMPSLAEALSRTMHADGLEATRAQVAMAAQAPAAWSLNERDLNNLALTYWFSGQRDSALSLFTSYLSLMPDRPSVYATLAEALADAGRTEESKARYAEALAVARRDARKYARDIARLEKLLADGR